MVMMAVMMLVWQLWCWCGSDDGDSNDGDEGKDDDIDNENGGGAKEYALSCAQVQAEVWKFETDLEGLSLDPVIIIIILNNSGEGTWVGKSEGDHYLCMKPWWYCFSKDVGDKGRTMSTGVCGASTKMAYHIQNSSFVRGACRLAHQHPSPIPHITINFTITPSPPPPHHHPLITTSLSPLTTTSLSPLITTSTSPPHHNITITHSPWVPFNNVCVMMVAIGENGDGEVVDSAGEEVMVRGDSKEVWWGCDGMEGDSEDDDRQYNDYNECVCIHV